MNENNSSNFRLAELKSCLGLTLIAGLLRALYLRAFISTVPNALFPQNDAKAYWELGLRIFRDGWLLPHDGPFYQAPLYPYALALLHHLGVHRVVQVLTLQAGLGVVNVLLTYAAARVIVPRRAAFAAALLFGACHLPLYLESKTLAATLGLTLFLAFALAMLWAARMRRVWLVIAAGVLFGLAALCRPNQIFTLPFAALYAGWLGREPRRAIGWSLAFCLAFMLTILPSTLRNGLIGGDWVPFTANAGVTLYMGTNPDAQGGLSPVKGLSNDIEDQRTQSIELASRLAGREFTPSEASNYWVKKTIGWAAANPLRFIELECRKFLWAFYHTPPGVNASSSFEAHFVSWLGWLRLPTILALIGGLAALPLLWRDLRPERVWLLALLAGYLSLSLIYYASDRFLAAMLPFLSIQAALLVETWRTSRRSALASQRLRWAGRIALYALIALNPAFVWNRANEVGLGFYNLGVWHESRGQNQEAFEAYREAYERIPNNPSVALNLGVMYARRGDLETSTRLFERVLELDPANDLARRNLEINRKRLDER
ncbi:MAG: tetratricopeptide repeat protein [bacterium]|nr:tetratricopeptide repeat protein [bacterium]